MYNEGDVFRSGLFMFTVVSQNEVYLGNKSSTSEGNAFYDKTFAKGRIIVPSNILGYDVIGLTRNCFYRCYSITSLRLPNTLLYIDDGAICDISLKEIFIPASVISIGNQMDFLWNCTSLIFEEGSRLKTIGSFFLRNSKNIKTLVLPPFLQSIGPYSMSSTNNLEKIYFCGEQSFENSNLNYAVENVTVYVTSFYSGTKFSKSTPSIIPFHVCRNHMKIKCSIKGCKYLIHYLSFLISISLINMLKAS